MAELFSVAVVDPRPWRLRVMHQMYGVTEGQTCKTCIHLIVIQKGNRYYKCDLTTITAGPGSDWRVGWAACGRWAAKGEASK
jgi:hypothetical protein